MSATRNSNSSRLQLEDIEAIKILKARYGYYCDDSYDPDGISSLFVEDGVWDGGQFGRYEGRNAIHDFFRDLARDKIGFAMHLFMNPLIEVSGDTAQGHWYLLCPLTLHEGNQATWCAGRYRTPDWRPAGLTGTASTNDLAPYRRTKAIRRPGARAATSRNMSKWKAS